MIFFDPAKTLTASIQRDYWRAFHNDGGFLVLPSDHSPVSSADGVSAELSGQVQLGCIRDHVELKLSLLRHRRPWASDDDDDPDKDPDKDDDDDDNNADDELVLRGMPVPFNKILNQAGMLTLFRPGSFAADIINRADVGILINFNHNLLIARTKSGTASLYENARGLQLSCLPAPTSYGRDLLVSIQRGDVTGCACACVARAQHWEMIGGERVQVITDARLVAIALAAFADDGTVSITQQSANDLAAAAAKPPLTGSDRRLLGEMGIQAAHAGFGTF